MTSAPAPRDERGETGYLLAGFGQGPGNVLTAFWGVAFLALAAIDATCHPSNGVSSGADGARCTDEDTWDETLWLSLNGTFCREGDDLFGVIRYTHDTAKPGCGAAFTAYREVKPFTCNCTGVGNEHAFMGGWLRVGLVVIFPATIVALIVAITSPVVGTFLDFSTNRKSIWMVMWVVNTVAIAGMAVLGHDYLWVVGGFFFLFANFTGGFALLLRQSYLPDLAPDDASRVRLGGLFTASGMGAQVSFVIIVSIVLAIVKDETDAATGATAALICAFWGAVVMPFAFNRLGSKPARRDKAASDVSMCQTTWSDMRSLLMETYRVHPHVFRYLVAIFFFQNGAGTSFVTIFTTSYFPVFLDFSSTQVGLLVGIVLLVGTGSSWVLSKLKDRFAANFTWRRLWIVVTLLWLLVYIGVAIFLRKRQKANLFFACVFGGIFGGVAVSWYFAIIWPTLTSMIPSEKSAQFSGLLVTISLFGTIPEPFIYSAIVQTTNYYFLAAATLLPWLLIGAIIMSTVDFEKGAAQAGQTGGRVVNAVPLQPSAVSSTDVQMSCA